MCRPDSRGSVAWEGTEKAVRLLKGSGQGGPWGGCRGAQARRGSRGPGVGTRGRTGGLRRWGAVSRHPHATGAAVPSPGLWPCIRDPPCQPPPDSRKSHPRAALTSTWPPPDPPAARSGLSRAVSAFQSQGSRFYNTHTGIKPRPCALTLQACLQTRAQTVCAEAWCHGCRLSLSVSVSLSLCLSISLSLSLSRSLSPRPSPSCLNTHLLFRSSTILVQNQNACTCWHGWQTRKRTTAKLGRWPRGPSTWGAVSSSGTSPP